MPLPPSAKSSSARRVILRPLRASDRDALIALARASRAFHAGLVNPPRTPKQFDAYLARSTSKSNALMVLVRRQNGELIGAINFSQIFYGQLKSAYMGYFIGAPHANQGYMTEGFQLALRYAFRILKLHRVEANIQPGNTASVTLVKHAGFTKEGFSRKYLKVSGRWRDHERWAMLCTDWKPARRL